VILEDVVAEHADEAAFLWRMRDAAVHRPHYRLRELTGLDGRVEAHLDGLRIAGNAGWDLCTAQLGRDTPAAAFTAGVLAFGGTDDARVDAVLGAVITAPESVRGLISALGWVPHARLAGRLPRLLRAEAPALRRVAIAGCAAHRQDAGPALAAALSDDDVALRALALRAAGESGRTDLLRQVRMRPQADEACRFAAAAAALLLGDRAALSALQTSAGHAQWGERAVRLGMRAADQRATAEWQRTLARGPRTQRLGTIAAGQLGDPAAVPWLLEQMAVPEYARIAGEALSFITGVDLSYDSLDQKMPDGFQSGPTDDPADENVEMDADEDLPWPDVEKVAAWWSRNRGTFQPGTRHLLGKPITPAWMLEVLKIGGQRHRAAAALELTFANPGRPLFEVRAPGFRQQQALGVRRT
jgi:uncharacterized protein (TIGR02270 family)